jgi:hypothetical protein
MTISYVSTRCIVVGRHRYFGGTRCLHLLGDGIVLLYADKVPIPVAARSKAWVCGRSLAAIVGSNHIRWMDVCLL